MESIYSVASPSSSVIYGNIAQHTKELIKSIFPNSFFKYEHISSEIAYRNLRRQLGAQSKQNVAKREKPYLVIRPMISVPDEMYLYNTPLTSNMDHIHTSLNKDVLIPIINDTDEALRLMFKLNRDKIEFQVTVTVSTMTQQIDIYKSLANVGLWYRPFTRRLPLEYMIPRPIVAALASRQGMDLSKEAYAANIFLDYINRHSNYPITYKMRNSTSRDEYFMYSNQEVLFTFEDFSIGEGQYKNMVQDSFEITFRVTAEFNLPGLFVLVGDQSLKESTLNETIICDMKTEDLSFPLFTIENLFNEAELDNGFKKYKSSIMAMDPDKKTGDDVTMFGVLLGDAFQEIVRAYCSNNVPIDTLAILQLYKNGEILTEGKDYSVDWYNLKLTTYKPSKEDSYRLIMYVNTIKLNQIVVEYQDKMATDKPKVTPN